MMVRVLTEKRYQPASEKQLLNAFTVLDTEQKGYLTRDEITQYMTDEGEPFTKDEIEEMLHASIERGQDVLLYKDYVTLMVPEEDN
ncbi:dynein regulatory complex protein 8-like [Corticium candelabrum]|uniref:dynein regulatory complex protein 8-like n=1 Tax=Corticium candelabrum TaxID=121492 RepID=UPI002E26F7C2|nr:dynein regulatory complex protein 8-like [Corticium candelabrum]